jgi:hypothetical protein
MVCTLHADAGNEMGDILQGKFGMTLEEAKNYLLAQAKDCGLEPTSEGATREGKGWYVSFYEMFRSKNKDKNPLGGPPWQKLRELADEMGCAYDRDGDPPWTYTIKEEKEPAPGTYKSV